LPPSASEKFIYFVGDDGRDISALMTISNTAKGTWIERTLILTAKRKMGDLHISEFK